MYKLFERHLNIVLFIGWIVGLLFFISFVIYESARSDGNYLVILFSYLIWIGGLEGWILKKKKRSLWNLPIMILLREFGVIWILCMTKLEVSEEHILSTKILGSKRIALRVSAITAVILFVLVLLFIFQG